MGHKLLLADDSITIQKVVGIIFASEDYELTVVDNGDAALEKAREVVPDIILVDALMPGKTGYEVCSEIRRDPALANIPLLLLVGAFEPFDEDKAKGSGADDFISKPFESQQLMDKVKHLIETGKQRGFDAASAEPIAVGPASGEERSDTFQPEQVDAPVFSEATSAVSLASLGLVEASPEDDLWCSGTSSAGTPFSESIQFGEIVEEELHPDLVDTVEEIEPYAFSEEEFPLLEGEAYPEDQELSGLIYEDSVADEPIVLDEGSQDDFSALNEPDDDSLSAGWGAAGFQEEIPSCDKGTSLPEETVSVKLSESELKAAIAEMSRETIERIVWEVVPDLAEVIIREEIRKIKEGYR